MHRGTKIKIRSRMVLQHEMRTSQRQNHGSVAYVLSFLHYSMAWEDRQKLHPGKPDKGVKVPSH